MKDNYWMFPAFCAVMFFGVLLLFLGGMMEGDRIYDRCLENNKTMIHEEAVRHCKNVVRG